MPALKILHVFGKMNRGGAEMRTLDLLRRLNETVGPAVRFDFCILSGEVGELDENIRELGGRLFYLPMQLNFGSRFKMLLSRERYDCVHSHVQLFSGYLLRLAHQINISSRVSHIHTTGGYGHGNIRKSLQNMIMKKWLYRYATDVIAVSQGALEVFLHEVPRFNGDKRVKLVYDAIDPKNLVPAKTRATVRAEFGLNESNLVVVHVGRLDPVKNHPRLLRIFTQLHLQRLNSRLVLIGDMPADALENLKLQARELNIESKVIFLGTRSDVVDCLSAADIMIFPSLWEGLPGAVLEAAAVGLPVVATDLPGCLELGLHFSSIDTRSLRATDEDWVQAALASLASRSVRNLDDFGIPALSPFHVDTALAKFLPIWKGMSG